MNIFQLIFIAINLFIPSHGTHHSWLSCLKNQWNLIMFVFVIYYGNALLLLAQYGVASFIDVEKF